MIAGGYHPGSGGERELFLSPNPSLVGGPYISMYARDSTVSSDPKALALRGDNILAETPIKLEGQTWHTVGATSEPAFQNSWAHRSVNNNVRLRKDAAGNVHAIGAVTGGPVGQSTIFTLPTGYRPALSYVEAVVRTSTATAPRPVQVTTAGNVIIFDYEAAMTFASVSLVFSTAG